MKPTSSKSQDEVNRSKKKNGAAAGGWANAVELCEKLTLHGDQKVDAMFNQVVQSISPEERPRCQRLFYGAVRHLRLINHMLDSLIQKPPRPRLRAILTIALAEWLENISEGASVPNSAKNKKKDDGEPPIDFFPGLENDESFPKIVDFAVNQVKRELTQQEGKFTNAVLRRIPGLFSEINISGSLSLRTSHPDWLVKRWIAERGTPWTERMLLANQTPAKPYFHWIGADGPPPSEWLRIDRQDLTFLESIDAAEDFKLTSIENKERPTFLSLGGSSPWSVAIAALKAGQVYAQDPATALAPALADVRPGEAVLDLCAAPGGKASYLLEALGSDQRGLLVMLDRPGPRIDQLDQNLRNWSQDADGPEVHLVAIDLLEAQADEFGSFDAVVLDAPCSNTGVIRRRPDVKSRLQPEDIESNAALQLKLLTKAAEFVSETGRLVYSTCSLEHEENAGVVERFLEENPGWQVVATGESNPADHKFDGATVFRLQRQLAD